MLGQITPGLPQGLSQAYAIYGVVVLAVLLVVNLAFALGVGADAKLRIDRQQPLAFVGPGVWFLATVVGSFLVVALYWALHYSSFRSTTDFPDRS